MLSNPKLGTRVILHYAQKWRDVPHINTTVHGRIGTVVVRGKRKPRNHGVEIDGKVYVVPCGNIRYADPVKRKNCQRGQVDFEKKFWKKVDKSGRGQDACWLWTGAKATQKSGGHGTMCLGGQLPDYCDGNQPRLGYAHRISWVLHFGPVPAGKRVLIRCNNPLCVRPTHLFLGTSKEIATKRVRSGRQTKGEGHGRSKLTHKQVQEIRYRHANEGESHKALAREYGVHPTSIYAIVHRINWKYEQATKTCSHCKEDKSLGEFFKDRRNPDGLNSQCKACHTRHRRNAILPDRSDGCDHIGEIYDYGDCYICADCGVKVVRERVA